MLQLRRALVFPVIFCGVEGILWYWELHSAWRVPSFTGSVSPAKLISSGLNFPAFVFSICVFILIVTVEVLTTFAGMPRLSRFVTKLVEGTPDNLIFLLGVVVTWYLVGGWLDRRASQKRELKAGPAVSWVMTPQPLVLALGVLASLYPNFLHVLNLSFVYTIERAFVQTWAVFLIGVPVSGLARQLLIRGKHEKLMATEPAADQFFSNFRLLVIVLGVFAALLIIGVLTSPTGPK